LAKDSLDRARQGFAQFFSGESNAFDWPRQARRAISIIMYRRLFILLILLVSQGACGGLLPQEGFVFFKYSLWKKNVDGTFSDIGCADAGIETIRADLFFKGVSVGGTESICGAFGNEDGVSIIDELGEFLADFNPTTFDQLQITALRGDGTPVFFGLRLNEADRDPDQQQAINFADSISLSENQQLNISLPGEPGSQIDNELQMIIP
jgi:hypothetical protein